MQNARLNSKKPNTNTQHTIYQQSHIFEQRLEVHEIQFHFFRDSGLNKDFNEIVNLTLFKDEVTNRGNRMNLVLMKFIRLHFVED